MSFPRTFRAPGRVNLIGEHTDYNLGFVLPIALDLSTYVETRPSPDGMFHLWSDHRKEKYSWPAAETANLKPRKQWTDYVAGTAFFLAQAGVPLEPLEMSIRSDVLEGSGLSSSAALEVSSALAFLQGRDFPKIDLAKLCQRAEIEFVGMPCGIMDQFVSLFGQAGAAIRIDCRSLQYQPVTLPPDTRIVAVNSMVKHELGASAYRIRVAECAAAAKTIGVASLRDATLQQVEETAMDPVARKRAHYIVTENQRVEDFVAAAAAGDAALMGRLFNASHAGMRDEYEISCEEIDFLAQTALGLDGCYGSRMTGGGFGGCTVNLVRIDAVESFRQSISKTYQARFGVDPVNFLCMPGAGAAECGENYSS